MFYPELLTVISFLNCEYLDSSNSSSQSCTIFNLLSTRQLRIVDLAGTSNRFCQASTCVTDGSLEIQEVN